MNTTFTDAQNLRHAWTRYLRERRSAEAREKFALALVGAGFDVEGACLAGTLNPSMSTRIALPRAVFGQHEAFCGDESPRDAPTGSLWFDPVDATLALRVVRPANRKTSMWMGIRPVLQWQFDAFLDLFRWRTSMFYTAPAHMFKQRSSKHYAPDDVVIDATYWEARSYSWFLSKGLFGETDCCLALDELPPEQFEQVILPSAQFWNDALADDMTVRVLSAVKVGEYLAQLRRERSNSTSRSVPPSPLQYYQIVPSDQIIEGVTFIVAHTDQWTSTPRDAYRRDVDMVATDGVIAINGWEAP